MNLNKITSLLFFSAVIGLSPFVLSGCDNGSSGDSGSSNVTPEPPSPPEPPEPIPPEAAVPEATSVSIRTLYTTERLEGNYSYTDSEGRIEGKSARVWLDAKSGEAISQENPLTITQDLLNKSVKYCVTPVTFDGVNGDESCSPAMTIAFHSKDVAYSTDWNTDTDYINDPANNDVRNGPSGNIHFYYNINLTPIPVAQSKLGTLGHGSEVAITRNYYDAYNFDNVYATVADDGTLQLTNNTTRYIKDPVVRINDDNYYTISDYTLDPFKVVSLSGYNGPKVNAIAFVDTNPSWKMNVAGFMQDSNQEINNNLNQPPSLSPVISGKKDKALKNKPSLNAQTVYGPVNEEQAEKYNANFRVLRVAYNRFDVIKYYFDFMNNNTSLSGENLNYPFDNLSSEIFCTSPDPAGDYYNSCGSHNVVAPYAYRLHELKRLVSHEPDNMYKILISDSGNAVGRSDVSPGVTPGTVGTMDYTLKDVTVISHENGHRQGYSDASGIAYGWGGDTLPVFLKNMDFYHLNNGSIDVSNPAVEQSDYFADYKWIDNKTVDVHIYSKGNSAQIKNIAVLAEDEESGRSMPNFFGTWDNCNVPNWTGYSDCLTWTPTNWDGYLRLDNQLSVINDHTIRIRLEEPVSNYSRAIMVYGSSADTNDNDGVWKTNYTQQTADSFAIQIPYDREMNIQDVNNKVAYVTKLNDPAITRGGSTGHIGLNGENNIRSPDFFLDGSLYTDYTADAATQHCQELGYTGLGVIPLDPGSENDNPLGILIQRHVYNGTMVGLSHADAVTPQIVLASQHNGHPITSIGNIDTDKANLIVCALP